MLFSISRQDYVATFKIYADNLLGALRWCGGYYKCPIDANGRRLGPLVGYAGTYFCAAKQRPLHFVGDEYANFAKLEEHPFLLACFAAELATTIDKEIGWSNISCFCGAPMGGILLSNSLAEFTAKRCIFPEKKVTQTEQDGQREGSILVWNRHEPTQDDNVVLVEDVVNNFKTTEELVGLVRSAGAKVIAICSLLNRSPDKRASFVCSKGEEIPIISLLTKPIPEHWQNEIDVSQDILAGNVVWKPKKQENWTRLMGAMESAQQKPK